MKKLKIIEVLEDEAFKEWLENNQEDIALIARQGGIEGFFRSIIGARMEKYFDRHFVSERYRVDLMLLNNSGEINYIAEFKHNFISQSELSEKRINEAGKQLDRYLAKHSTNSKDIAAEIVYFVTCVNSDNGNFPNWAKKYLDWARQDTDSVMLKISQKIRSIKDCKVELENLEKKTLEFKNLKTLSFKGKNNLSVEIHVFIFGE